MLPQETQQLIAQFTKLPGIGPRQAARFVFYLLRNEHEISSLLDTLKSMKENITLCKNCFLPASVSTLCAICVSPKRDKNTICLVEKETDALNFEKTGQFQGHYFVLGGFIDPLHKESIAYERLNFLVRKLTTHSNKALPFDHDRTQKVIENSGNSKNDSETNNRELILALTPRREGDFTSHYIEEQLKPLKNQGVPIKITRLGRGLSSGAELEYADGETLKNALAGRR
ncbi:MAG: recombination protein RecR [Candidatus Spechtbacteria bacterium]|nr:recombination protein RecR [Candidatus Spechtbacteria bacterium]